MTSLGLFEGLEDSGGLASAHSICSHFADTTLYEFFGIYGDMANSSGDLRWVTNAMPRVDLTHLRIIGYRLPYDSVAASGRVFRNLKVF
jgi:hypothetical protein